jgi:hypothetical protein
MGNVKIKASLCLINQAPRYEDVWGSGGIDPPLLIWALDGGKWSASRPGRFPLVYNFFFVVEDEGKSQLGREQRLKIR